jgi:hypothetical protein
MRKMDEHNPEMSPTDTTRRVEQLTGEISEMIQSTDRANLETAAEVARLEIEQQEEEIELNSRKRMERVLWVAVAVLAAGLIGVAWYSYPLLQKYDNLLSRLESGQQAEQARLEQLRDKIDGLRRETGEQIAETRQDSSRDLGNVSHEMASTKRNLDELTRRLDHKRVDFAAAQNQTRPLVPGISLKVTHTDPSRQNVDGLLQLAPEGHTFWVRGQDINQPLVFFTERDQSPYELVFTRVTRDSVAGYVLAPVEAGTKMSYSAVPSR